MSSSEPRIVMDPTMLAAVWEDVLLEKNILADEIIPRVRLRLALKLPRISKRTKRRATR